VKETIFKTISKTAAAGAGTMEIEFEYGGHTDLPNSDRDLPRHDQRNGRGHPARREEKKCCLLESKWKIKYDLLRN